METLLQDLRYAVRTLSRSRGFTAAAVVCLALGIGVNTAIFSVVNAILLRPLPFERPDEVVAIHAANPRQAIGESNVSMADLMDWKAHALSLADVAGGYERSLAIADEREAELVGGYAVTPNTFGLIGARPVLGRGFLPQDGRPDAERVIVLSHELWRRRYGGLRTVVGKKVLVDGEPRTVIGVMPPRFRFPERAMAWVPIRAGGDEARSERYVWALGRLRPGATAERAAAEVAAVSRRLAEEHPETNAGWTAVVLPYRSDVVDGTLRTMLTLMLGAVGFVLLIACANVANLLLARATVRRREIAVRAALGAGRGRLVRQLLTESVLVALLGGTLGVLVAVWWLDWVLSRIPEELPYWMRFGVDARVLAYTAALSVGTGIVFGVFPALRASRTDLQSTLKEGGRGLAGAGHARMRNALVAGEIALSLMLLVGAALMIRSFVAASKADLGFETERLLTVQAFLTGPRYQEPAARAAYFAQAVERAGRLPGVAAAAAPVALPSSDGLPGTSVVAEGQPVAPGEELVVGFGATTPGLFRALGRPLVAGRDFTAQEAMDTAATAAIVSREVAERLWPGQDPLGKRVRLGTFGGDAPWLTVVGVAPSILYDEVDNLGPQSRLQVHLPYARLPWQEMALLVRTHGDPAALAGPLRRAVRELDPTVPVYSLRTMDEVRRWSNWPSRLWGELFGTFGGVALLLAGVGVYGVMAYAVSQRVHEIGIRMALGARAADVVRMVMRQGAVVAAAGVGAGLLGALAIARLMSGVLFGVSATDLVTFVAMPLALAAVALFACWMPARRAARVDPMVALRSE